MGDDSFRRAKTNIFAVGPVPAGFSLKPKDRLVKVKCASPKCHNKIWIKKSKTELKRKPKCNTCNRADALDSATQGQVAAYCNVRNEAARRRTDAERSRANA